jgi:hypothetical protein
MTAHRQVSPPTSVTRPAWRTWVQRLVVTVLLALTVGWTSSTAMKWDATLTTPAGFGRGLLHGALMPLAWPTLIIGRDQTIYAPTNSGRTYKLGYSLGVNACGLLFFGWFFTRLRRWRTPSAR